MDRGLYIAATGMLSELVRQDQIANDLANSSTPGYKPDRSTQRSFQELLLNNTVTGQRVGSLGMGVEIDSIETDLSPAPMRLTEDPLDFAIDGEGFFGVRTPQGVRYTRNGQFSVSANGTLVNSLGYEVLSQNGGPIRAPRGGNVNERALGVFSVPNARKQGESLFTGAAGGRATGSVRSGTLEGSGAEPSRSMVDMIASFRAFEASQRAIRTIDDTLAKATQQVGTIS